MTLPSGNGQADAAHSVSMVLASDHPPLTAVIDETTLATVARQDTGNAALSSIDSHVDGLEASATSIDAKLTSQATAAKQDTGNTSLAAILAALDLLKHPTRSATVSKSDSTDITATATKGLLVGNTAGDLVVKYAGDSVATTIQVGANQYVPGAFSRVMVATTAATIISLYGP